jgi:hypothetical protein
VFCLVVSTSSDRHTLCQSSSDDPTNEWVVRSKDPLRQEISFEGAQEEAGVLRASMQHNIRLGQTINTLINTSHR